MIQPRALAPAEKAIATELARSPVDLASLEACREHMRRAVGREVERDWLSVRNRASIMRDVAEREGDIGRGIRGLLVAACLGTVLALAAGQVLAASAPAGPPVALGAGLIAGALLLLAAVLIAAANALAAMFARGSGRHEGDAP